MCYPHPWSRLLKICRLTANLNVKAIQRIPHAAKRIHHHSRQAPLRSQRDSCVSEPNILVSGRSEAVVEKAIENSLAFGILHNQEQVGFARVVTDQAMFTYLADVYVLESHRGKGLAKRLLEEVLAHGELQGLCRFLLATNRCLQPSTLTLPSGESAYGDPLKSNFRHHVCNLHTRCVAQSCKCRDPRALGRA